MTRNGTIDDVARQLAASPLGAASLAAFANLRPPNGEDVRKAWAVEMYDLAEALVSEGETRKGGAQ